MKVLALAFAALMAACSCASVPSHDALRATALRVVTDKADAFGLCGGTPVAADAFDTATHCLKDALALEVNGHAVEVARVTVRSKDRVTVHLTKPLFHRWAKQGKTPKQGERVRFWGNPNGLGDVYRVGPVVAVQGDVIAVDAMVCKGDSGSGLFNDTGELVAVVSMRMPEQGACQFMVAQ